MYPGRSPGSAFEPYGRPGGDQQQQQQQQQYPAPGFAPQASAAFGAGYGGFGQPAGSSAAQQHPPPQQAYGGGPQGAFGDPFVQGLAANVLQQSGASYLQRGQAYMQSRMGFLSLGLLQYPFNVDKAYVRRKLAMLLTPFLSSWNYTRIPEQVAGAHKYLPPRQDVNAPDLYIPFLSFCTYCLLCAAARLRQGRFQPEGMYGLVSSAFGGWVVLLAVLKGVLWVLGIPSALPAYELLAYSGYTFVPTCLAAGAALLLGVWGYRVTAAYGAVAVGTYLVKTLQKLVYVELRGTYHSTEARYQNYVLLTTWLLQLVFVPWAANLL